MAKEGYYRDLGNNWFQFNPRVPSDDLREEYMYEKLRLHGRGADSIMVLCAIGHVVGLEKRFREAGHAVRIESVQNFPWYSNPSDVIEL